jgi:hypothetical protein
MTLKELFILDGVVANKEEVQNQMKNLPKPYSVGGVKTPDSLNDITIGELMELQSAENERDFILKCCTILLSLEERNALKSQANSVIGFVSWVSKELERINKLFESTNIPPTAEEKQAGVESLKFGMFGVLDYYALRMGITDHEEVEKVKWIRIYKCLDMDAKKARYEKRLRTIISQKK